MQSRRVSECKAVPSGHREGQRHRINAVARFSGRRDAEVKGNRLALNPSHCYRAHRRCRRINRHGLRRRDDVLVTVAVGGRGRHGEAEERGVCRRDGKAIENASGDLRSIKGDAAARDGQRVMIAVGQRRAARNIAERE